MHIVGASSRESVADFGCGPGLFLVDSISKFGAAKVYGFDSSENMLKQARVFLETKMSSERITLTQVDFDKDPIPLGVHSINLGFSGFMLHEVEDPQRFVSQIVQFLFKNGVYAVYDFISGNEEAFVSIMNAHGMDQEKARKRYPHMCKHSIEDLEKILKNAGLSDISSKKIDDIRAIAIGLKR